MPSVGFPELIVIAIIALVVLGPKRLPDAGRSIGKGMREFKEAISGDEKAEIGTFAAAAQAPAQPQPVAVAPQPVAAPAPVATTAPAEQQPVA